MATVGRFKTTRRTGTRVRIVHRQRAGGGSKRPCRDAALAVKVPAFTVVPPEYVLAPLEIVHVLVLLLTTATATVLVNGRVEGWCPSRLLLPVVSVPPSVKMAAPAVAGSGEASGVDPRRGRVQCQVGGLRC